MANDLLNIHTKPSKFGNTALIIFTAIIIYLLKIAQIFIWYKLTVLAVVFIFITLNLFAYALTGIRKLDILIHLRNTIIWEHKITKLAEIKQMYNIGFAAIIIKLNVNNKLKNLIIFYDNLDINQYKHLMRYIRWQH